MWIGNPYSAAMTDPSALRLVRETSPDGVARYVRELIVTGVLRRGDRVPQDEIAATLGVSRIPVREAMIALDREGWVSLEPHRGAFVHGVDEDWVRDHYDLLGALYALAVQRASERATDDELTALTTLQQELAAEDDIARFDAINQRLMRTMVTIARSPRLEAALRGVTNIIPGNFFAQVPGTLEPQRRGLTETVESIVARDGERAAAGLRALPTTQGAAVVALLRARGVLADPIEP
jgi:DNA-binding GntR family transcriptional regulator